MIEHVMTFERPSILEIGVEYGQCSLPLITNLLVSRKPFEYVGIDVLFRETFTNTVSYLVARDNQVIAPIQMNSLEALPKLVEAGKKYDLILVDGDHNYYTVSKELELIRSLCNDKTLIIIDDYSGKWSEKDLYYSERPDYASLDITTKRHDTEKKGVRPAVDEFLEAHPEWSKSVLMAGEPVMLTRSSSARSGESQESGETLWDW